MNLLFYICENPECHTPQIIHPMAESALQYAYSIICCECGHEHTEFDDLANYAKATGDKA